MLPRHKQLLRSSPIRRGAGLRKAGRKTKAWERVRRQLKCEFTARGIQACELRFEGCMVDDYLGFAHSKKRRYVVTDEDWREVVLACRTCHDRLDINMSHEEMARTVRDTIARRKT